MKCKKCGSEDIYEKGKYRRCRDCHRETDRRSYQNRKLGTEQNRRSKYHARPVSESLQHISPVAVKKRSQQSCNRGHSLDGENVRVDIDSKGRAHRRCRKCEAISMRVRYGLEIPSVMRDMLRGNYWEALGEEI